MQLAGEQPWSLTARSGADAPISTALLASIRGGTLT